MIAELLLAGSVVLGVFDGTLGRFEPDSLTPVGASLAVPEPHTGVAFAPDRRRFALGLSSPGEKTTPGTGRVGLWIVDPATMTVVHEVRTGIATEAVVYPGVVGAFLQNGMLDIVDPATGKITSTQKLTRRWCAPVSAMAGGRGIIVGGDRAAVIERGGRVHVLRVGGGLARSGLGVAGGRAYIAQAHRVLELDPRTLRITRHGGVGGNSAVGLGSDRLEVAGNGGLKVLDTRTWRVVWQDRKARSVLAGGNTLVASASGRSWALAAGTGKVLWRAPEPAWTVAAGRVYTQSHTRDLRTGAVVGTHTTATSGIRLVTPQ